MTVEFASAALWASHLGARSMAEEHRFIRRHRRRRHAGAEDPNCSTCRLCRTRIACAKQVRVVFRRVLREWDAQWFGKFRERAA
jgi:hypothetical protein